MYDIPRVHLPQYYPAIEGSGDVAIGYLQSGVINLRLVGAHLAIELIDRGLLGVDLLLCNTARRNQRGIAIKVQFGIAQRRLILEQLRLHLFHLYLEGSRIDYDQQFPLLHILAFSYVYLHDLAVNAALDVCRIESCHRSKTGKVNRYVLLFHLGHCNRDGTRTCSLRLLLFGVAAAAAEKRQLQRRHDKRQNGPRLSTSEECEFLRRRIQIDSLQNVSPIATFSQN